MIRLAVAVAYALGIVAPTAGLPLLVLTLLGLGDWPGWTLTLIVPWGSFCGFAGFVLSEHVDYYPPRYPNAHEGEQSAEAHPLLRPPYRWLSALSDDAHVEYVDAMIQLGEVEPPPGYRVTNHGCAEWRAYAARMREERRGREQNPRGGRA